MIVRKGIHPGRKGQVQFLEGDLIEDRFDDIRHIALVPLQAVDRHTCHVVPGGDIVSDGPCPLRLGAGRVEQHQEGLTQLLQFRNDPVFRFQIVLSGNIRDGSVGGDDNADGGVLRNDLSGADLRRLRHRNLMVEPRRGDHPGHIVLELSRRTRDHVAHAVDETDR